EFAPRVGLSIDPTGTGRMRVFGSYGWFFESIPLNINQRSFSQEGTTFRYVDDNGELICWGEDGNPLPGGTPTDDGCTYDRFGVLGGSNSPVVNDLKGQYHEEVL